VPAGAGPQEWRCRDGLRCERASPETHHGGAAVQIQHGVEFAHRAGRALCASCRQETCLRHFLRERGVCSAPTRTPAGRPSDRGKRCCDARPAHGRASPESPSRSAHRSGPPAARRGVDGAIPPAPGASHCRPVGPPRDGMRAASQPCLTSSVCCVLMYNLPVKLRITRLSIVRIGFQAFKRWGHPGGPPCLPVTKQGIPL